MVGCVQSVVEKNTFLVKFKYGQKKEISSSLFVFLSPKEDFDID